MRRDWRAEIALLLIALVWGSTFVLVKAALADISTILYLALRFLLAGVVLMVLFHRRWSATSARNAQVFRGCIIVGSCLFLGYVLQTTGLRLTTPSKSAFLTGLSIPLVPFVSSVVYRKWPAFFEVLGVTIATAGMALVTLDRWDLRIGLGDLLTMGCAVCFAVHLVAVSQFSGRVGFELLSVMQIFLTGMFSLLTFAWVEQPFIAWSNTLVAALIVTGLLGTAGAFTVQAWAQQRTTATRAAVLLAAEPVFAAVTSYVWSAEILPPRGIVGAVLILAGILVVELKPFRVRKHLLNSEIW